MISFQQIKEDKKSLEAAASFLNFVMKKDHFTSKFLEWQYLDNPTGKAIAICAFDDGRIVGHYSAQPILSLVDGKITSGLFILNAAVDPANQGKGLLRGIADRLHEEAAAKGFQFMIGVGNNNSTPIYTKKFGFRLIGPLDVKIGAGIPEGKSKSPYFYQKTWDQDSLNWRLSNPCYKYSVNQKGGKTIIYKKNYPMLSSIMGVFGSEPLNHGNLDNKQAGLNLFLGIDSAINWKQIPAYFNFPEFAKPSPLNLIFRELNGANFPLSKENILFRCIDFDAF
ncbi:MAG: GNAT family N-acetyltransferase [Bacteroidetes bacterium]|nr:GNAT family N-acetyltransferase [Bacteroidota bacterium]